MTELVAENAARDRTRARVRDRSTPACSTEPLLRRGRGRVRQVSPDDILMRVTATNRGPDAAPLHLLLQLWARNTWAWSEGAPKPSLRPDRTGDGRGDCIPDLPPMTLDVDPGAALLFCDNETNATRLFGVARPRPVQGRHQRASWSTAKPPSVNPGTKRDQGAAHVSHDTCPPGPATRCVAACAPREAKSQKSTSTRCWRPGSPRPTQFYAALRSAWRIPTPALVQRQALRRDALVQAVLPPRRAAMARRRPANRAVAAAWPGEHPQRRLAARQQRRHHLHAGQLGVPLVRGVGPGRSTA